MKPLTTESRLPASSRLDALSTLELVELMNAEDALIAGALAREASVIARAIDAVAARLQSGGRLIYVGAGTSGRLGVLDASECPPTFGVDPSVVIGVIAGGDAALRRAIEGAEDRPEAGTADLRALTVRAADVVVGIAASGNTPYVLGAIDHARRVGALTIGVTCNRATALHERAEVVIAPDVGPEVLTGSTRLKAGTATKLVLNMLSTGAMVRLGKVFGNLMVDLRVTNTKLAARARRIVAAGVGCTEDAAETLLQSSDGDPKTAIVQGRLGISARDARDRLASSGGRVRDAISPPAQQVIETDRNLVIGVDGGGTKTIAWLAAADSETTPLGRGAAGPANPWSVGFDGATRNIETAIRGAFRDAGLTPRPVAVACLSLAGVGRPDERRQIGDGIVQTGLAARALVVDDAGSVMAIGVQEPCGIALICGTGTLAVGHGRDGALVRAGGWGYLLADEGSAYAIALAGLRAGVRAADGRAQPSSLQHALFAHFRVSSTEELIAHVYGPDLAREELARLAPIVFAEAERDATAAGIVSAAASDLASLVLSIAHRIEARPGGYTLAMAGSVLVQQDPLRAMVVEKLEAASLAPELVRVVTEPVAGAVAMARAAVSRPPT